MKDNHTKGRWEALFEKTRKPIKLDKKDLKILTIIIDDPRASLNLIQKEIGLAKPSIINRIEKYKREGLIGESSIWIDFSKLGIKTYHIEIKTGFSSVKKKQYIEYLKQSPYINQIITLLHGNSDLLIRILAYEDKLEDVLEYMTKKDIKDFRLYHIKDVSYKGLDYFKLKSDKKIQKSFFANLSAENGSLTVNFDNKDIEIISLLFHNSKIGLHEIADDLNISTKTAKSRIIKLVKQKIIHHFFTTFNPFLLGFLPHIIKIKVYDKVQKKKIIEHLTKGGNCHGVFENENEWSLLGILDFKNRADLETFEESFLDEFEKNILDYEIVQIKEQVYYDMFPEKIKEYLLK